MDLLTLAPIVERLADACAALREVGTAADLAAATAAGGVPTGGAAVATVMLLGAEPYEVKEGSGPLRQGFDVTVGVILRLGLAGQRAAAGLKALETPTAQVRAALFGWEHPSAEIKFRSAGEGVEDFDAKTGVLVYRLDFVTRVRIQEPTS